MSDWTKLTSPLFNYVLPRRMDEAITSLMVEMGRRNEEKRHPQIRGNAIFRNCHKGKRCFIFASGPSIKTQDLMPLKDEFVISVSNSFVHHDFGIIKPRYHCVPDVFSGHRAFTAGYVEHFLAWLREMDKQTEHSTIFLSERDRSILKENGIFQNPRVHYLLYGLPWEKVGEADIDLCRMMPDPQSVSVVALCLALFMGFEKIYLLGCDHNWLSNFGQSSHFYGSNQHVVLAQKGYSEWKDASRASEMECFLNLRRQYIHLGKIAKAKSIEIFYATPGGWLDVFPIADLSTVLAHGGEPS